MGHPAFAITLAVAVLSGGACDRARTGSPVAPSAAPSGLDISGSWSGTKDITWDPMDGGGSCAIRVVARFDQQAATVRGRITDVDAVGCNHFQDIGVTGTVQAPWVYLALPASPGTPAVGRMDGDRLIVTWFNVRWTLER
jgi:hypothetical protein